MIAIRQSHNFIITKVDNWHFDMTNKSNPSFLKVINLGVKI